MITIKFRGKSIDGKLPNGEELYGKFVYGNLLINQNVVCRILVPIDFGFENYKVAPHTVGQFTGLCDKNGNEIYEGDIVCFDDTPYCVNGSKYQGVVLMYKGAWCVKHYEKCFDVDFYSPLFADDFANRKTIILGNIFDNPELMKGGEL